MGAQEREEREEGEERERNWNKWKRDEREREEREERGGTLLSYWFNMAILSGTALLNGNEKRRKCFRRSKQKCERNNKKKIIN